MNCIICFENAQGSELNPEELWCHGHVFHTKCLFQWCQQQKISILRTRCIACINFFPDFQQEKLIKCLVSFQEEIFEVARKDEIQRLRKYLNQNRLWSEDCFVKLVKVGLSSKSFRISSYLRHIEGLYLDFKRREALTAELFDQGCEMSIRWLLNDFNDQSNRVFEVKTDFELLELMRMNGNFRELMWVYQVHYKRFTEKIQLDYVLYIFRAFKQTKFEFCKSHETFVAFPTSYHFMLSRIACEDLDNSCYIMGKILPYAMMKE